MKKLKIFPLIIMLCLFLSCFSPAAFAIEDPDINARAAVLVDLNTGNVIFNRQMDQQRAPASLTKIMTALLAFEAVDRGEVTMDDMITAQDNCRQGLDESSSTSGIVPGLVISLRELLYCTMLQSANEACNVIAAYISGSVDEFVVKMNQRAAELGCTNTHFANTNGLPAEGHVSTAYDLYLITAEALKYPEFIEICNTKSYTPSIPQINGGEPLQNSNALINPSSEYNLKDYPYKYASGVKTGYTRDAGYCLISTAENEDMHLLAVILGCDGYLNAGLNEYKSFSDSAAIYDWAFDNFSYQTVMSKSEAVGKADVENARGNQMVILKPEKDVTLLLPNDISTENVTVTQSLNEENIEAPVAAGTVLGKAQVMINGVERGSINLVASNDVELAGMAVFKLKLHAFFSTTWLMVILVILLVIGLVFLLLYLHYLKLKRQHIERRRQDEAKRAQAQRKAWEEERAASEPQISYEDELFKGYDFSNVGDIPESQDFDDEFEDFEDEGEGEFASYDSDGIRNDFDPLSDVDWDDITR